MPTTNDARSGSTAYRSNAVFRRVATRLPLVLLLVLLFSMLLPNVVMAQTTAVEFNRWDARITARSDSAQLQIAETQEIRVTAGTLSRGMRFWTQAVQVQNVFVVYGNSGTPEQLTAGNGTQRGTYSLTQSGSETTLNYALSTPQSQGAVFTVQISYLANSPTRGMVDWRVVPAEHDFTVRSSTVRLTFPSGQVPDAGLVRASQSNANVQIAGNEVIIQSAQALAPQEAFSIQIPYGSGVGAAGNAGVTGGQVNPVPPVNNSGNNNPAPGQPSVPTDNGSGGFQLPGIGTIALVLCGIGLLVLVGGGGLLRSLLGSVGGSLLGGGNSNRGGGIGGINLPGFGSTRNTGTTNTDNSDPLGGLGGLLGGLTRGDNTPDSDNTTNNPFPTIPQRDETPPERGFRPSADQDRNIGKVGNDKDSGGGASFS